MTCCAWLDVLRSSRSIFAKRSSGSASADAAGPRPAPDGLARRLTLVLGMLPELKFWTSRRSPR